MPYRCSCLLLFSRRRHHRGLLHQTNNHTQISNILHLWEPLASQTDNNDILVSNYGPTSTFSKLNTLPNICYAHELHTTMPKPPSPRPTPNHAQQYVYGPLYNLTHPLIIATCIDIYVVLGGLSTQHVTNQNNLHNIKFS